MKTKTKLFLFGTLAMFFIAPLMLGHPDMAYANSTHKEVYQANSFGGKYINGASGAVKLSMSNSYVLVLKDDGSVWRIKRSDNSIVRCGTMSNFIDIAAADTGFLFLSNENKVFTSGVGTTSSCPSPSIYPGPPNIDKIAAGENFYLALTNAGTVLAWGDNSYGQLGNGTVGGSNSTPTLVPGVTGVADISAGIGHVLALKSDGNVISWGSAWLGALGGGGSGSVQCNRPVGTNGGCRPNAGLIPGLTGITSIKAAGYSSVAIDSTNRMWGWGDNKYGKLGFTPPPENCSSGGMLCWQYTPILNGKTNVQIAGVGYVHYIDGKTSYYSGSAAGNLIPSVAEVAYITDLSPGYGSTSPYFIGKAVLDTFCTSYVTTASGGMTASFNVDVFGGTGNYTYNWSLSDGSSSSQQSFNHTFSTPGTYTSTVTVTSGTETKTCTPNPVTVPPPLQVTCNIDPNSGTSPLNTYLYAFPYGGTGSYSYSWDFGDGTPGSTVKNPTHTYAGNGSYTALVTVTSGGISRTCTATVTVQAPKVATPVFSPGSKTFTDPFTVSISTTTTGASIYYRVGADPTPPATCGEPGSGGTIKYSTPITVSNSTTVKAIACKTGMSNSSMSSATYSKIGIVAPPTFDPPGGTYYDPQTVTITSATTGAYIRYGANVNCTTGGIPYTGPINVSQNTILQAIACKDGWTPSSASATYFIMEGIPKPVLSPAGGVYYNPVTVTMTVLGQSNEPNIHVAYDSDTPTCSSPLYTGPIPVNERKTVKAVYCPEGEGGDMSDVAGAFYNLTVANPVFDPVPGSYETLPQVEIKESPNYDPIGASIKYTTDESVPSETDIYSGPITLSGPTTIKAVAGKTNWNPSNMITGTYLQSTASGSEGCGESHEQTLPSIPTTELCSDGSTPPVEGEGPWTWSCNTGDNIAKSSGNNFYGQLGNGVIGTYNYSPVDVLGLADIVSIQSGNNHSVALKSDGTVWAWGRNQKGQLARNPTTTGASNVPVKIEGLPNDVIKVVTGNNFNFALTASGEVWSWGDNDYGQLGQNIWADYSYVPARVKAGAAVLTGVKDITAGFQHALAIVGDNNRLYGWGWNAWSQVQGVRTSIIDKLAPFYRYAIPIISTTGTVYDDVKAVSAGTYHSMMVYGPTNRLYTWGGSNNYELCTTAKGFPTPIDMINIEQISAGTYHSLMLKDDGTLWGCGSNEYGALGDNVAVVYQTPHQLSDPLITDINMIEAGQQNTLILRNDGKVVVFGYNLVGVLGNGESQNVYLPEVLDTVEGVTEVSTRTNHTHFLVGSVSCYADKLITGICGSQDNTVCTTTPPTENLCDEGDSTPVNCGLESCDWACQASSDVHCSCRTSAIDVGCGTLSGRTYDYDVTNWPITDETPFCLPGNIVSPAIPGFPDPGDTTIWGCSASPSGPTMKCSASRSGFEPVVWDGNVYNSAYGQDIGWVLFGDPADSPDQKYEGLYSGVTIDENGNASGDAFSVNYGPLNFDGTYIEKVSDTWSVWKGEAKFKGLNVDDPLILSETYQPIPERFVEICTAYEGGPLSPNRYEHVVCINKSGQMYGYAWSDAFGWLKFGGSLAFDPPITNTDTPPVASGLTYQVVIKDWVPPSDCPEVLLEGTNAEPWHNSGTATVICHDANGVTCPGAPYKLYMFRETIPAECPTDSASYIYDTDSKGSAVISEKMSVCGAVIMGQTACSSNPIHFYIDAEPPEVDPESEWDLRDVLPPSGEYLRSIETVIPDIEELFTDHEKSGLDNMYIINGTDPITHDALEAITDSCPAVSSVASSCLLNNKTVDTDEDGTNDSYAVRFDTTDIYTLAVTDRAIPDANILTEERNYKFLLLKPVINNVEAVEQGGGYTLDINGLNFGSEGEVFLFDRNRTVVEKYNYVGENGTNMVVPKEGQVIDIEPMSRVRFVQVKNTMSGESSALYPFTMSGEEGLIINPDQVTTFGNQDLTFVAGVSSGGRTVGGDVFSWECRGDTYDCSYMTDDVAINAEGTGVFINQTTERLQMHVKEKAEPGTYVISAYKGNLWGEATVIVLNASESPYVFVDNLPGTSFINWYPGMVLPENIFIGEGYVGYVNVKYDASDDFAGTITLNRAANEVLIGKSETGEVKLQYGPNDLNNTDKIELVNPTSVVQPVVVVTNGVLYQVQIYLYGVVEEEGFIDDLKMTLDQNQLKGDLSKIKYGSIGSCFQMAACVRTDETHYQTLVKGNCPVKANDPGPLNIHSDSTLNDDLARAGCPLNVVIKPLPPRPRPPRPINPGGGGVIKDILDMGNKVGESMQKLRR